MKVSSKDVRFDLNNQYSCLRYINYSELMDWDYLDEKIKVIQADMALFVGSTIFKSVWKWRMGINRHVE